MQRGGGYRGEARRAELQRQLAALGDLRPGSLGSRRQRCRNPNCRCKRKGEPGHGPYWYLAHKSRGKSVARSIPAAVERTRQHIAECKRLRKLTAELVEVSDRLCQARLMQGKREQA